MKSLRTVALLASLLVTPKASAQQIDQCSDAFTKLPQNIVVFQSDKKVSENLRTWFCSEDFEKQLNDSSTNLEFTVPIKGVPVPFKAGANNTESMSKRSKFCGSKSYSFSDSEAINLFTKTLPPEVQLRAIDAWDSCMNATTKGLVVADLSAVDTSRVVASVKFNKTLPVSTPKITNITVSSSLKCAFERIKVGKLIPIAAIADTCTWDDSQDALFIVHNSLGFAARKVLPARLEGKLAGSATLYVELLQERLEKAMSVPVPMAVTYVGNWPFMGGTPHARWEGAATLQVPDGRLTDVKAVCTQNCDQVPQGPDCGQVPQNCPQWGARARFAGPDGAVVVQTGVSHWKSGNFGSLSTPVWEFRANWRRPQPTAVEPKVFPEIYYGKAVTFSVPRERTSADVEFRLKSGTILRIPAGGKGASGIELIDSQESGANQLFTYLVKPPGK